MGAGVGVGVWGMRVGEAKGVRVWGMGVGDRGVGAGEGVRNEAGLRVWGVRVTCAAL